MKEIADKTTSETSTVQAPIDVSPNDLVKLPVTAIKKYKI
jgi:hypothetical protein